VFRVFFNFCKFAEKFAAFLLRQSQEVAREERPVSVAAREVQLIVNNNETRADTKEVLDTRSNSSNSLVSHQSDEPTPSFLLG